MKKETIATAKAEAKRFLSRVSEWENAQGTYKVGEHTFHTYTPKQGGALRRASLDLTRALAEMRKP
ncbi:MAG: hypothetical protein INF64_01005 [Roseomonas sp.]|nr:hypothetical protein [Roseomonas sp.]